MYVDGGALNGGQTLQATTPAGSPSLQDLDGGILFLGFTEDGGGDNVQYIGLIDEVIVHDWELTEAHAKIHFLASGVEPPTLTEPPQFGPPVLADGVLTLNWTGEGVLQETDSLSEDPINWSDVTPAPQGNTYDVQISEALQKFYRLVQ
jgi:hypothetical protein